MKKLSKVLSKAIPHDEALRMARAHVVLRDWNAVVGEELGRRSRPDRYGKGVVWVAVTGSAWAQELRMRKELILGRLRERSGESNLFLDVRFGVRPISPTLTVPPVEAEVILPREETDLSIGEMARRRLAKWKRET